MRDADLLDRILDGNTAQDADVPDGLDDLAVLADMLAATAPPVPPMAASAKLDLRNELLRQANAQIADPPSLMTRARQRMTILRERVAYSSKVVAVSSAAAMTLSTGGVAAAAASSLPGDLFYDVKLAYEDTMLSFSDSGVPRGAGLLGQAETRVGEAERAVRQEDQETAGAALRLADAHARDGAGEYFAVYVGPDGGDVSVLRELGDWVIETNRRLDGMPALVGEPAMAMQDLRTALNRIGQRIEVLATGACSTCQLGVHDDPDADTDQARGVEADGSPPMPAGSDALDLTVIPAADEPFQACPCSPRVPAGQAAPTPTETPGNVRPTDEQSAAPPPSSSDGGGSSSGGSGGGSGGGGGGGGGTVPLPDTGPVVDPVTEPLPEPVRDPIRDAVEDVIESLPDDGGGSAPAQPDLGQ